MRRLLDVLFQHLRWMLVVLVAVPCLLFAATLARGSPEVVTALVRVDLPTFVTDVMPNHPLSRGNPGDAASALVEQLVATTWFADRVVTRVDRTGAGPQTPSEQTKNEIRDLQAHLAAGSRGTSLLILSYTTDSATRGVRVLDALLGDLGDALTSIESQQAASALASANLTLQQAHDELHRALDDVRSYVESVVEAPDQLRQDTRYRTLTSAADAKAAYVQAITDLTEQSRLVSSTLPQVHGVSVHVVDPPRVAPHSLWRGPATAGLVALGAVGLIELLLAYVVALRDPRLRSVDDVLDRLDAISLVSLPRLRSPSP
jgi:hypothetical protein